MAGTQSSEELENEEMSEDEALRQMEEAFLAGPGANGTPSVVEPPVEDDSDEGEPASAEATPAQVADTGTGDTIASSEPPVENNQSKSEGLTEAKVLELLKSSQTAEEWRDGIKKLRDEAFGKLGGLERTLKALQEGFAAPGSDEDLEEHFKELRDQYPDAAPLIIKGMKEALKKAKSIAITTSDFDPEEVTKRILPVVEQHVEQKFEERFIARTLDREHKGWREMVGAPDSNTPFRQWLAQKPDEERTKILSSFDVDLLSDTLTEFKKSQKPKETGAVKPSAQTRTTRIEQAVTPKSQIKPPMPRQKTPEEEMEEGFREGPGGRRL